MIKPTLKVTKIGNMFNKRVNSFIKGVVSKRGNILRKAFSLKLGFRKKRKDKKKRNVLSSTFSSIKDNTKKIISAAKNPFDAVMEFLSLILVGWLVNKLPIIINWVTSFIEKIRGFISKVMKFLSSIKNIFTSMVGVISAVGENIATLDFKDSNRKVEDAMKELNQAFEGMLNILGNGEDEIKNLSPEEFEKILGDQAASEAKKHIMEGERDSTGKIIPSTDQIRIEAERKRGGDATIGGGNAGSSSDSGGTSENTIKSGELDKTPTIKFPEGAFDGKDSYTGPLIEVSSTNKGEIINNGNGSILNVDGSGLLSSANTTNINGVSNLSRKKKKITVVVEDDSGGNNISGGTNTKVIVVNSSSNYNKNVALTKLGE